MTRLRTLSLVVVLSIGAMGAHADGPRDIDCVIEPKSIVDLTPTDEGMITEILVERGDRVEAGRPVVRLDDELQRLQVDLTALRATSDVAVRSQRARLEQRRRELDRARELTRRNVASAASLDEARIEVALTELAVEDAALERRLAEIEHARARARLARRRLTSPVDGVVMSVDAAPGEYAHEQLTIMRIAEVDPLRVEVFAPAELFGEIAVGEVYDVAPLPPLEGRYRARVTVVDPIFDAASATFGVRLEVPNPGGDIPAGVRCSLRLDG